MTPTSSKILEEKIGYKFKNEELLREALTHSSFANEQKIRKCRNYERLEFLGDAVLELASSKFFFLNHPDMLEGEMTKLRSSTVCEQALAFCAKDLSLGEYIHLGKGEEATGGRDRDSIISDVMEALIGAIYLDSGFEEAESFILKYVLSDLETKQLFYDSKTILQEKIQKRGQNIHYEIIEESGPDHDKQFTVEAYIDDKAVGRGVGRTKKSAEQQAAYAVLIEWEK
ncbi:MAG: ribonuclease III [Lachnospiraceae bacterium]|nr:ribonuclease III [Lachnospiraceae bacterium]MBD5456041.1 ribonuclease III [Lachnospiraceae bacterium]